MSIFDELITEKIAILGDTDWVKIEEGVVFFENSSSAIQLKREGGFLTIDGVQISTPLKGNVLALSASSPLSEGNANTIARSDHSHSILTSAASSITPDLSNQTGTSSGLARDRKSVV